VATATRSRRSSATNLAFQRAEESERAVGTDDAPAFDEHEDELGRER
jgi:hypothetical protein